MEGHNLFLEVFRSNNLEQLEFKLEKNIGIQNMQENLENYWFPEFE